MVDSVNNVTTCAEALESLEQLRPGGPWVLSAIVPDGKITTITARNTDEARQFIRDRDGKENLYFSANPTRRAMSKKAAKADIAAIEYLFGDLDPKDKETPENAKVRYLAALDAYSLAPTAIIDSGNGIQALWRLQEPIKLAPMRTKRKDGRTGWEFPPETESAIADVEARTEYLMKTLGSVAGTQNIDRVLRLPGTINLPNAVKIGKGRVPCPTSLIKFNGVTHPFESFPKPKIKSDTTTPQDAAAVEEDTTTEPDIFEEQSLHNDLLLLVCNGIWEGRKVPKGERSERFFHAVGWLKDEGWSVTAIIALLRKYPKGIAQKYITSGQRLQRDERAGIVGKRLSIETRRAYDKAREPEQDDVGDDDTGDSADKNGQLILSDSNHMGRARKMRDLQRPHLVHYRDDFMDFKAGAYLIIEDGAINANIWTFLDKASAKRKDGRGKDAELKVVPFFPNRNSVGETLAALKAIAHLNSNFESPCWLNGRKDPPPDQIIAFPNGLLDLRSNKLHPVDQKFFTIAALGFDYVATVASPTQWLRFLDEIFAGDDKHEQVAALQEMFGYLLTVDTSQEKAFLLLGPKRSGKGTMLGMLRKLLASSAVAGPALKSLGSNFGLAPIIDKQLAIIDDLRVGSAKDQDVLIENVLKITGRGLFTIDRKYKTAWTGMLPVKLLLVSNVMPKLGDDSAALASRFIIFTTRVSFYGREDSRLLEDKLAPELAGVFHWALEGLQRLRERGHFLETSASEEARERLANLGSPARAFIAERCVLDPRIYAEKRDLYDAWCSYARENNFYPGTLEKFCEGLYAAGGGLIQAGRPSITIRDKNGQDKKHQINACMGIDLEPDPDPFSKLGGDLHKSARK